MQLEIGGCYVKCPYCGATEFVDTEDHAPPAELACARCGGAASRKLLLEAAREEARRNGEKSAGERK